MWIESRWEPDRRRLNRIVTLADRMAAVIAVDAV